VTTELASEQLASRVAPWLEARLSGATGLRIDDLDRPASGFSAETLIVPVTYQRDGRAHHDRFVLRKETPDPAIYPAQASGLDVEIHIQYQVMCALAEHSDVPVAPLIGYEPDARILGAPFFVMQFIDGVVPVENPIYTREGFFVDSTPDERRRLVDDGLRVLARVHALDWRAADLEWLIDPGTTPSTGTQLAIWEHAATDALNGRVHPPLARAFTWLRERTPTNLPVTLCWGDPRPGNMIWQGTRCVCATDFEAASIAPAEVDLGWWLMFDRWSHEAMGCARLDGEPTRDEQRARYAEHTQRDPGDTFYFEVFAAARYTAIVVRVMNRMVARGDLPADQTIWLDNPATDCLLQLLDS
jgi:aminoglycoside phosphotransferase (APT) family kinase protein